MCILILKKAEATPITKKILKTCFDNNNDGAGYSYVNTDHLGHKKVVTYKNMKFNPFYKKLRRAERLNPESNFMIHFRIGTSGVLSTYNCHPFKVSKDIVMGHNGIIGNARKDPENKKNDTQMFIEDTVKELPKGFMRNKGIQMMMGSYINASKLVFLNVKNQYTIINEEKGEWIDDVWFSNTSYKPRVSYYPAATPRVRELNFASWLECDYCSTWQRVAQLKAYDNLGFVEGYCDKCEKKMLEAGAIHSHKKTNVRALIDSVNKQAAH